MLWDRLFQQPSFTAVHVMGRPARGALAMAKRGSAQGFTRLVLHAPDSATADPLVRKIPSGAAFIHLTDETPIAALRARASEVGMRPAWLFSLEPNEFADLRAHETRPVAPADAGQIAAAWAPDWPGAEAYVRRRIERGPSAGIALDGRLVAWALTHFLTDRVAMLGFFHVLEPHRGKGYAKSVASSLVREALALGKIPALHVFTDNEASLHLVDRLGFRRIRRQVWGDVVLR